MKYFILLLAVVVLVRAQAEDDWQPKNREEFNEIRRECHKEFPFSQELKRREDTLDFPDEEKVRNYEVCVFKKWGIFDEATGFNRERLIKEFEPLLPKDKVVEIVNKCADKNEQGTSVGEWAYRVQECFHQTELTPKYLELIGTI